MNTDELLKIEQQGADFVRALIPHTALIALIKDDFSQTTADRLWQAALTWRQWTHAIRRKAPDKWRKSDHFLHPSCAAFFAGAETAIREWEAANVDT